MSLVLVEDIVDHLMLGKVHQVIPLRTLNQ